MPSLKLLGGCDWELVNSSRGRGLMGGVNSLRMYPKGDVQPGPFLIFSLLFHILRPYCVVFPLAQLLLEQNLKLC